MGKSIRKCTLDGCEKLIHAKGLCQGHYTQQARGQVFRPLQARSHDLTLEQRMFKKVHKGGANGCWEWTGATDRKGYGRIKISKRMRGAHRIAWEMANGPIPDGMDIDHRCANPSCVNPEHLRVVTRSQNNQHRTGPQKNSKSGVRGVYWNTQRNAWQAHAKVNGRIYWGGLHPTVEAADAAARALRAELHTHDDHDEWLNRTA